MDEMNHRSPSLVKMKNTRLLVGAMLPLQAERIYTRNRRRIERIAQRLISGGRPGDRDGWMWILALLTARPCLSIGTGKVAPTT